jgi:hypothetical protein
MIDPIGSDFNDPASPSRKSGEVVSGFDFPGSNAPLRPKIRYADYDSPEALAKPNTLGTPPMPTKSAPSPMPPPRSTMQISKAKPTPPSPSPSTALARPIPPKPGKLERAISVAKTVLPIVGNLLPLLEGNVVGAASNLIGNRQASEVDLKPLEEAITALQSDQRALTFHTSEQKRAIRHLEDEFTVLQEAVQKHSADQAELAEQLVKVAKRLSGFMRLVIILLIVSILFTTLLVVRIAYILRP